jgi:hypothetical protein
MQMAKRDPHFISFMSTREPLVNAALAFSRGGLPMLEYLWEDMHETPYRKQAYGFILRMVENAVDGNTGSIEWCALYLMSAIENIPDSMLFSSQESARDVVISAYVTGSRTLCMRALMYRPDLEYKCTILDIFHASHNLLKRADFRVRSICN